MDSLFGIPLPFQRRLTKMYTDTKSSYDFVKELVQSEQDPEVISLHRKLRIQKDRLISWGLMWSGDCALEDADIDESINKAGLSELVGSVMSTIKEILAEAEPLWQASKKRAGGETSPGEKGVGRDRKQSLIVWDRSRFQDLVRDLTMSIDTLYDISRTQQSVRRPMSGKSEDTPGLQAKGPAAEEKMFESTRMQTPQQIDPKALIWPRDLKNLPSGTLPPAKFQRQIVFMRRPNSDEARRLGAAPTVLPALLEYAAYDPIYSITGVTPSMTRFEKLFAALSQSYVSTGRVLSGLLHLIGYFEEPDQSRFCLLYALPTHFGPVDISSPQMPTMNFLSDLLFSRNYEPSLEVKYRLAYNVANAVFDLHTNGVVHGNIASNNILFIEAQSKGHLELTQVNMRHPYLTSCDLFPDNAADSSDSSSDLKPSLYRHSLDARATRYTRLTPDSKSLDLYSLAMLLLEIGLWTSLPDIFPTVSTVPKNPAGALRKLAARCGSLYVKAVQACWRAPDDEISEKARPDVMHQKVLWQVSKALDTCCAIDESSDDLNESSGDYPPVLSTPIRASRPSDSQTRFISDGKLPAPVTNPPAPVLSSCNEKSAYEKSSVSFAQKPIWSDKLPPKQSTPAPMLENPRSKLRTFPSVRIDQERLDFWHSGLIPHINHVLRNFYKKYPESVEISLESIGESPSRTQPTILVICTSVNKVRSILGKSLVYDRATYGLKVCRGKVVRSRKRPRRSTAGEFGTSKAVNIEHQERPLNGASIGAYVGERHLPPVSFGGLVVVDGKPYGMTVHHMLDDPSDDEDSDEEEPAAPILRSSAHQHEMQDLILSESSAYSSGDEEYLYTLSDYDSDFTSAEESEAEFSDSYEDRDDEEEDDDENMKPGDIKGIPQGCGDGYLITQPAIDDVSDDFFPSEDTRDEDHLNSFQLGELYASSGIRRRTDQRGIVHEIDWVLFKFSPARQPATNHIKNGHRFCLQQPPPTTYPVSVAPSPDLGNLAVHGLGRSSGLQSGRILPGLAIVKIFGRQTPSSSYQVAGGLGIPGDSGAWVVDNERGRACGHVLAWSAQKMVAYICPMDVLVADIGETLRADSVRLPGGEELYSSFSSSSSSSSSSRSTNSNTNSEKPIPVMNPQIPIAADGAESDRTTKTTTITTTTTTTTTGNPDKKKEKISLNTQHHKSESEIVVAHLLLQKELTKLPPEPQMAAVGDWH
ncbi:het-s domain containing protein [Drepanopeziza brunnea f. sp. 'multigermtubi' MB_m1]|uniref:Het-s domain containing protein n=1 Tax=Marssonina brunnea f. sp. multigermtubi (strain MB_m1) TaxID=1072389 RepID=K1WU56_MARBU|nr:het-s domain containing protein [Drepanopeziza brunnea f. sp. 'multigermtubi' MB_m1]EKD21155.1 het-s domain containing protein [Drepanopeziza brunnea f. sp. 'multigermtubi' MB_m1]